MQAIIFIGIQATGKTTFYNDRFFNTHVRISLDQLKTRHREREFLATCLRTRQSFVVDNTNPTIEDRKRYIDMVKDAEYEIIGYYFESKVQAAVARNDQRTAKQRIPVKGVLSTYHKLQMPSYKEGFDRLYYVRVVEGGTFNVEEWKDEIR
jgi:predicted kinase